ncbi:MAG: hypothetical protein EOP37_23725 [Rubrivivax sp.]|nr:MAG: hypothetical protein EOP37_23725 [Rubrivivax sp.]
MSWFKRRDLQSHKQWAYIAAKVRRLLFQLKPWTWFPAYEHLYALISDNEEMVNWYAQNRVSFFIRDGERGDEAISMNDPSSVTFHSYQVMLALKGEWEELHRRCERILSLPETLEGDEYLVDHRFYLALAEGGKRSMEIALNQLTGPKMVPHRNFGVAFGLTQNLIATHSTIYSKIAWRHGYEVEIDSPWVPRDWLPIAPLEKYEDRWPFLESFDIWQRFDGDWADWSPRKSSD